MGRFAGQPAKQEQGRAQGVLGRREGQGGGALRAHRQGAAAGIGGLGQHFRGVQLLTENLGRLGEVVHDLGPETGRFAAREHHERRLEGVERNSERGALAGPRIEPVEHLTQPVLRCRPGARELGPGQHVEGAAQDVGGGGERLPVDGALGQGLENRAQMFLGERPIERIVLPGPVFQGCLVGLRRHLIEIPVAPPVGQGGQGVAVTHVDGRPLPRRQVGRKVVDAGHGGVQRLGQRLAETQALAFAPGRRRGSRCARGGARVAGRRGA